MGVAVRVCAIGGAFLFSAGLLVFLAARGMTGSSPAPMPTIKQVSTRPGDEPTAKDRQLQRGAYLMSTLGCNDCHTPHDERGQPINSLMLTGHPENAPLPEWDPSLLSRNILATIAPTLTAYSGPFGTSIAPNLTPDKETGIGNMTAEQLIESWRTGKHWREDRPVLPPMPIAAYGSLTDEDIRDLHAFLMSLPPVKNKAPASRPAPMPASQG
jgi:hypothetical protein